MASAEAVAAKRPTTAYWAWLGEHRDEVVNALGGEKKGSLVSKKAGEMWKALSDAQKAPYEQRAKEAWEQYNAHKPEKTPKAKDEVATGGRKKPMTPVFAFIQAKRAEIQALGITALGAISKKGTELYQALPEEEKAKWQKRYQEELKEYKVWAEGEEGKAVLAGKKDAAKEKKNAKNAKEARRAAKQARKERREGGPAEADEDQDEDEDQDQDDDAASPAPKSNSLKRSADEPAEGAAPLKAAKGKGRGRSRGEAGVAGA